MALEIPYLFRQRASDYDIPEQTGLTFEKYLADKRKAFNGIQKKMSGDPIYGIMFEAGYSDRDVPEKGLLINTVTKLDEFADAVLTAESTIVFDKMIQLDLLKNIFAETMETIKQNWSRLEKRSYDWESTCGAVRERFMEIAKVFEIDDQMNAEIDLWFSRYRELKRLLLNEEALQYNIVASYMAATGADRDVVEQVREEIAKVNTKLDSTPTYPRYAAVKSDGKTVIQKAEGVTETVGQQMARKNAETNRTVYIEPKEEVKHPEVSRTRKFLRKIPLLGRWF